ncbi:hypothetical protein QLX08_008919 [Tetragonisca angustula]|uniref:Uncharacterized protein n=1 Tax=Tetragonisca angustula TaxID=166442 RepID=A0AAW0ZI83_9HYME
MGISSRLHQLMPPGFVFNYAKTVNSGRAGSSWSRGTLEVGSCFSGSLIYATDSEIQRRCRAETRTFSVPSI